MENAAYLLDSSRLWNRNFIGAIAFREDESRIRKGNGAENFAVLRHIALNLLKKENSVKVGIQNKRLKAGWDEGYLEKVLAGLAY